MIKRIASLGINLDRSEFDFIDRSIKDFFGGKATQSQGTKMIADDAEFYYLLSDRYIALYNVIQWVWEYVESAESKLFIGTPKEALRKILESDRAALTHLAETTRQSELLAVFWNSLIKACKANKSEDSTLRRYIGNCEEIDSMLIALDRARDSKGAIGCDSFSASNNRSSVPPMKFTENPMKLRKF